MDIPLPFSIFVGIVSIMAFFIICIACSLVLRNLCYLGNNNLMWRSTDARRAADMQAEQQTLTLHPPPPVAGNEGQPFLTQNQLVQPIPSQEQTKQEFPAQGHQMQYYPQQQQQHSMQQVPAQGYQMQHYPQQQHSMQQGPAQGHQMQHYSQQQEFQQPSMAPQFQPLPTAPEIYNQDLPPPYGQCVSYK